jgi:hypothetical protein
MEACQQSSQGGMHGELRFPHGVFLAGLRPSTGDTHSNAPKSAHPGVATPSQWFQHVPCGKKIGDT